MKKLLTYLLLAVVLNGSLSASAGKANTMLQPSHIGHMGAGRSCNMIEKETEPDIHPLDILAIKFN